MSYPLFFLDFAVVGDNVYFSNGERNGLYKADITTGEASLITTFNDMDEMQFVIHSDVVKFGHQILFFPCFGKSITVYDIATGKIQNVLVCEKDRNVKQLGSVFCTPQLYKNCVYLVGESIGELIRINLKDFSVKSYDLRSRLSKLRSLSDKLYFKHSICRNDNKIYAISETSDFIMEFDIESEKVSFHNIDCNGLNFRTMDYNEGFLWATTEHNNMVKINVNNYECEIFQIGEEYSPDYYNLSVLNEKNIWLFPRYGKNITIYNMQKNNLSYFHLDEITKCNEEDYNFIFSKREENTIYIMAGNRYLYVIRNNIIIKRVKIHLSVVEEKKYLAREVGRILNNSIRSEDKDYLSLDNYLNYILYFGG